jgi:hypothetical protein
VRDLAVQQALVFYHKNSNDPNELVITAVGKDAVSGYLMLPAAESEALGATANSDPFSPSRSTGSEVGTRTDAGAAGVAK